MSQSFGGIQVLKFRGNVNRLPITLPQQRNPVANSIPPSVVPMDINWNIYWQLANNPSQLGIEVNLQTQSVFTSVLDRIASVKIDNTGSACSLYVVFPDTNDVVACPPNCSVTYPCLTNNLNVIVYAFGMTPGFIPNSRIFFYNVVLPPSVDYEVNQSISLEKASPTITRGNTILNTNFGAPALGDQLFSSGIVNMNVINDAAALWNTPYASGFLYITSLLINCVNLNAGAVAQGQLVIESTGVAGVLIRPLLGADTTFQYNTPLITMTGLQIKLDATQVWRIRSLSVITGFIQVYSSYTQTPI